MQGDLVKLFSNFGPKMSFCFPSAFGHLIFLCGGDVVKVSTAWLGGIPTSTFATGKEVKTSNSIYLFCTPKMDAILFIWSTFCIGQSYHTIPPLWWSLMKVIGVPEEGGGGLVDQSCWGWCSRWYFGIQVVVARCNYWGNRWECRCGGFRCW